MRLQSLRPASTESFTKRSTLSTLQTVTQQQNAHTGMKLTILDNCTTDSLTQEQPRHKRLQSITQLAPDKNSVRQAFEDCNSLLESRVSYMHALISACNSGGDGVLALPTTQQPQNATSTAVVVQTNRTFPPVHTTTNNHVAVVRTEEPDEMHPRQGLSEIQIKIEALREHPDQRRQFAKEINEMKRERQLLVMEGKDRIKEHSETIFTTSKPAYVSSLREVSAETRNKKIQCAQAHVKQSVNTKKAQILLKIEQNHQRLEMIPVMRQKAENNKLVSKVWALSVLLAHSVKTFHLKARPAPIAVDPNTLLLQHSNPDQPVGIPIIINTKRNARKPATAAFVSILKRAVATKHVRHALKDWFTVRLIPHNIKIYMAAVRTFQRYWRVLKKTRQYRRLMCAMQWERELDDLVRVIERKKTQTEREKTSAEKMQDPAQKRLCENKTNALIREKGELRGIPVAVKTSIIDKYVKEKETAFGDKVMNFLKLRKEIRAKVHEWVENKKFIANTPHIESKRRRGKRVCDDEKQALKELAAHGEVVHAPQPIFPIVTPKAHLHNLIASAKEVSRELVMKRLAANDVPPQPLVDVPVPAPSGKGAGPVSPRFASRGNEVRKSSLLPRKSTSSVAKRISVMG